MKNKRIKFQRINLEKRSMLKKYSYRVSGHRNLIELILYELYVMFFMNIPGALGLFIRRLLISMIGVRKGKALVIGYNVNIRNPQKMHFGNNVIIDDNVYFDIKSKDAKGISLGDNSYIYRNCYLSTGYGGFVKIGKNSGLAVGTQILGQGGVTIGDNVLIAGQAYITSSSHGFSDSGKPMFKQDLEQLPVIIKDNVWIGAGVKVLGGVTIGENSIIGAGAVVTKDIPKNSIAVGVPAKVIKKK